MEFACPSCRLSFGSKEAFDEHIQLWGSQTAACPYCDLAGVYAFELAYHIEYCHTDVMYRAGSEYKKNPPTTAGRADFEEAAGGIMGNAGSHQYPATGQGRAARHRKARTAQRPSSRAASGKLVSLQSTLRKAADVTSAPGDDRDDGKTCTEDALDLVREMFTYSVNSAADDPSSRQTWLCSACSHYASGMEGAGWACGYRNAQMLLSALLCDPTYGNVVFEGDLVMPSVAKIQKQIEQAWEEGFDPAGRSQLGGRLLATRKWIGASDLWSFFTSLRVRCELVDFHHPSGPNSTHPLLFEWVKSYFQRQGRFVAPLFLQHQGHSRTIIGYRTLQDGSGQLLLFDPSTDPLKDTEMPLHVAALVVGCNLMDLRLQQYQILAIRGLLSVAERDASKEILSTTVP